MKARAYVSESNVKMACPSVSLLPIHDCANCGACKGDCYALRMRNYAPAAWSTWQSNSRFARRDPAGFFASLLAWLEYAKPDRFRWHVAGDIPDQAYLRRMIGLAIAMPTVRFLCFTKRHNLDFSGCPPNLRIVLSMFPTMPEPTGSNANMPRAWVDRDKAGNVETRIPAGAIACGGKCKDCGGKCWGLKSGQSVWFRRH